MILPDTTQFRLVKLLRSTFDELDCFLKLVNEGKNLMEAKRFASFVLWNLQPIFDSLPSEWFMGPELPGRRLLPKQLEQKHKDLIWALELQWKYDKAKCEPSFEMREIEKLHHKLDLIAGELASQREPRKVTQRNLAPSAELETSRTRAFGIGDDGTGAA